MKNKKTIKRDKKGGDFTTIHYSVLRDKNLTSSCKILLIEILSDSESFKFSETVLCNRMGISKTAYYDAMEILIDNGYIRKTKIKQTNKNFYLISEYGNLNNKEPSNEEQLQEEEETLICNIDELGKASSIQITSEQKNQLQNIMMSNSEFKGVEMAKTYTKMVNEGFNYHEIKSHIEGFIKKEKRTHFNAIKELIKTITWNSRLQIEALKVLKQEVFNNNKKINYGTVKRKASTTINSRKPLDPESLEADRCDGI